ncbi:hypothetical protein F441_21480, partial [Phytophthora nicotianae CJ01A1]
GYASRRCNSPASSLSSKSMMQPCTTSRTWRLVSPSDWGTSRSGTTTRHLTVVYTTLGYCRLFSTMSQWKRARFCFRRRIQMGNTGWSCSTPSTKRNSFRTTRLSAFGRMCQLLLFSQSAKTIKVS